MLQQTRVEAVKPFFDRFMLRFCTMKALAEAPEPDVLACWSGLGYYSRARNVHRAAQQIAQLGVPDTYNAVMSLPGIGPYTAAAISSISLGLPHAAVDGNVMRVITRIDNDPAEITAISTQRRVAVRAGELLSPTRPGDFNQAMMELGATVCTPKNPACDRCPVAALCAARAAGTQNSIPVKLKKAVVRDVEIDLLVIEREGKVYLTQRDEAESRLAGFWELPVRDSVGTVRARRRAAFTHQIVNDRMRISVWHTGEVPETIPTTSESKTGRWFASSELTAIPLSTVSRKCLDRIFPAEAAKQAVAK